LKQFSHVGSYIYAFRRVIMPVFVISHLQQPGP
jgi:hypothetical protein